MKKIIIATFLCFAVMTGCTKTEAPAPEEDKDNGEKTVLLGLIPERNIFDQLDRYEPLADYISRKTGMKVTMKVLTRYGNIVDNFVSQNLDGAFFGSFTYALAHSKLGVEPLARPENTEGVSTYCGLIFVRKDSRIRTAKDMKGKTFALVDKATTAGYLLPLAYFRDNRIGDYRTYLKEAYFTGTHEDAVYDVLNKKADIGAAKNTMYYAMAKTDSRIEKELTVLTKSPEVPENGLAVRKDLDSPVKKMLKEALLNMHNDEDGRDVLKRLGYRKFIETTDADYQSVYDYMKKIDMDFSSYGHGSGP